ncbi:MAG: hypothetical protein DYG93_07715 [Leptolyngbya sp. PLA2]|nr:hypothetical protein [Leptolyngbya sp.]MCE7971534.1 hypothetical protein [Leptolyngbya sp. PL-A2]MCQ3940748.1 hypothetical protein [cyanobacterium CYA1]MDL1903718.1 hypothetical protein [Synechococcales cyanobacterium CNB]
MGLLRTDDGFELETTRVGNIVMCVCRREGYEVSVSFDCKQEAVPALITTEQMEVLGISLWTAGMKLAREGVWQRYMERLRGDEADARRRLGGG